MAAFTRFGLPADLDCGRMLAADPPALSAYSAQRLRLDDRQPLAIDCASIRARHLLPAQPMSAGEAEFPLAFSRTVYKVSNQFGIKDIPKLLGGLPLPGGRIGSHVCAPKLVELLPIKHNNNWTKTGIALRWTRRLTHCSGLGCMRWPNACPMFC
jgi:hypothetical protein